MVPGSEAGRYEKTCVGRLRCESRRWPVMDASGGGAGRTSVARLGSSVSRSAGWTADTGASKYAGWVDSGASMRNDELQYYGLRRRG